MKGKSNFGLRLVSVVSLIMSLVVITFNIEFVINTYNCGTGFIILVWLLLFSVDMPIAIGLFVGFIAITLNLRKDR